MFVVIKNNFGSYFEVINTPINEVLDFYNYIIFLNQLEAEEYNKIRK